RGQQSSQSRCQTANAFDELNPLTLLHDCEGESVGDYDNSLRRGVSSWHCLITISHTLAGTRGSKYYENAQNEIGIRLDIAFHHEDYFTSDFSFFCGSISEQYRAAWRG